MADYWWHQGRPPALPQSTPASLAHVVHTAEGYFVVQPDAPASQPWDHQAWELQGAAHVHGGIAWSKVRLFSSARRCGSLAQAAHCPEPSTYVPVCLENACTRLQADPAIPEAMEYQNFEGFQEYGDLHAPAEQVTAQGSAGGGHCPAGWLMPDHASPGTAVCAKAGAGLTKDCSRQRAAVQGRLRECPAAGLPAAGAARAPGAAAAQAAADTHAAAVALHPAARRGAGARARARDGAEHGAARAPGAAAAQAAADTRAAAAAPHPAARRGARARARGRDGAQRERTCLPAGRRAGAGARAGTGRAGLADALARCERAWRRHAAWRARAHAAW